MQSVLCASDVKLLCTRVAEQRIALQECRVEEQYANKQPCEVDNIVGVVCNAPPFAKSGRSGVAPRPWLKYRDNIRHRRRCDKTWKVAPRCGYALLCRYDRVAARQRRGLLSPQYTVHFIAIAGFKLIFPSEPHIFHKIRTSLPLATLDRAPRASPSIHVSAPLNGNPS